MRERERNFSGLNRGSTKESLDREPHFETENKDIYFSYDGWPWLLSISEERCKREASEFRVKSSGAKVTLQSQSRIE